MISGTAPVAVSAVVAGLLPETTYHFRVKARDPRGMEYFGQSMRYFIGSRWAIRPPRALPWGRSPVLG